MAYPDYYEEKGSRELTFNRRGAFGKKIFIAKWEYRFTAAPLIDTPFSLGYPRLLCNECTFEPFGKTGDGSVQFIDNGVGGQFADTMDYSHCRITALYEYDVLTGDEPQVSGECASDIINITQGRLWTNFQKPDLTPAPVEEATPVLLPGLSITYRIVRSDVPLGMIYAYTGCVNNALWAGAAAETMLYEGATWDSDYNPQNGQLRYVVQHRFRWRMYPWNLVWRPARQKLTATDGTPIYDAHGYPEYELDGNGNAADWDYPIDYGGNGLYLARDFNQLML